MLPRGGLILNEELPRSEAGNFAGYLAPEPGQCPLGVSRVVRSYLRYDHHVLLIVIIVDDRLLTD